MRLRTLLVAGLVLATSLTTAYAAGGGFQVRPANFDPAHTFLVQATWLTGIGCPTNPRISLDGTTTIPGVQDPACTTGDSSDKRNEGLLLVKTGETRNFAAATARITPVASHVTELGYDIRKPAPAPDPRGSHCGAGAPRFDISTNDGKVWFIGCNSSATPPTSTTPGTGWVRLRWDASAMASPQLGGPPAALGTLSVKRLDIVFDEGQDTGPDNFGAAILDNIDVNTVLVGHSPGQGDNGDNGDNGGNGGNGDNGGDKSNNNT